MKIAIITGASSGIGKEFVLRLDESFDYDELWLIARREDRLKEIKTKAAIRAIPLDLLKEDSIDKLKELLLSVKPEVKTLVNAGGFGKFGAFSEIPLAEQTDMIDLNSKALVAVTYTALPYMSEGAEIYEIGSLSAFQPVPYIGVYAATKAFVLSFSRALSMELKPRKIKVMAVCPFWTKTEFFNRAVTDDTIKYYARFYTAKQVVARALRDMKKGKGVSVMGLYCRIQCLAVKLLPQNLVMKVWCRQQKKEY